MTVESFDNKARIVRDDLTARLSTGDRLSVASAYFSIYAYQELETQLDGLDEFRFIYTSPTFLGSKGNKEQREFYIPRLNRERSLYGTQFEIKLRNELTQRTIARECADWIRRKARFKSFRSDQSMNSFLEVESADDSYVYAPFDEFTTSGLGTKPSSSRFQIIMRQDAPASTELLRMFDEAWEDSAVEDVTEQVIESITTVYRENPPELVYYSALFNIFSEFLDDISEDVLPNEGTGFKESAIWGKLYDFQRDAAISIINKLETYNGCILADSVGLGKTFTALAVIKYYESRNRNVLVLCPKKLADNWMTFRGNLVNNPIAQDRLRYDVLYHTDLSREHGDTCCGLPIERINWGNYDLVVIDESHNFRNGADTASKNDDRENRYLRLLNRIVRQGVKTKVLMLSATPVNNRFNDLKNQLALAYEGDKANWAGKLDLSSDVDTVFRNAQKAYNAWTKLPPDERTTGALTDMLSFDFFTILDEVTVARSRKHIQRHYDMEALGAFPQRNKPISKRAKLTDLEGAINYHEIYAELDSLSLVVYMPSAYILPSKMGNYEESKGRNLSIKGREWGIRKLMQTNLLKRLESSVHSFSLTLSKVLSTVEAAEQAVDAYIATKSGEVSDGFDDEYDDLDFDDEGLPLFEVGGKTKVEIADMDYLSWQRDLAKDRETLELLVSMIADITPENDAKLKDLCETIAGKVANPINEGNRKVLVFTAFADTADYLYEHVSRFAKERLGLETAIVTGKSTPRSTVKKIPGDMNMLLTCFSPLSKERDIVYPEMHHDIDILIGTDCISEGQNLQDCDYLINYDIHWNPVRIIQRFGRIDRIGSKNARIQLVNYWPDVELDEYIRLKERVEARMRAAVLTSTGDDDYINEEETGDLEYRERQLRQMQEEVIDLEDVSGGVSITDLGLNEFRMDLLSYHDENPDIENMPHGIHAVVKGDDPGILFVLRNVTDDQQIKGRNQLHPFYLVYVGDDGEVLCTHLQPKASLDWMRVLCRGKDEPDAALCKSYNKLTREGRDMSSASKLLEDAIASIIEVKDENDVASFFGEGTTSFLENEVAGLDDFELICFLVVR